MYIVLLSYSISDAGAVIHTHSKHAVMATLLYPGTEFRITHQEMIKGIQKNKPGKYKCMIFIYSAFNIYIYIHHMSVLSVLYIYNNITVIFKLLPWSSSYDSWIYNYLCNRCLSPLKF